MSEKIKSVRGMSDRLPDEMPVWREFIHRSHRIMRMYGYREISTPYLEKASLFARGIGEATDIVEKEMYVFESGSGETLALRPEGTAGVVRAALEHNLVTPGSITRLYYIGAMFRRERPQKGRFRQFHQIGAEVMGSSSPACDAEMVFIVDDLCRSYGLKDTVHEVNVIGCSACRPAYRDKLLAYLEKRKGDLGDAAKERMYKNPMRLFDMKDEATKKVMESAPLVSDHVCDACKDNFERVLKYLSDGGVKFELNPKIVRGLDYYTGFTFETKSGGLGAQNAVAGGGRYDGLFEKLGGPPVPATGFAMGIERFLAAVSNTNNEKSMNRRAGIYGIPLGSEAEFKMSKIARRCRENGIPFEIDWEEKSLKAKMKGAGRSNKSHALIIGENEIKTKKAVLRDLGVSKQKEIDLDSAEDEIIALLGGK